MFRKCRKYLWTMMVACLACLAAGVLASAVAAGDPAPPNWKGEATGTTRPVGIYDVDAFGGSSSHLGRFTAAGFHLLDPVDFTFAGQATWTASNGDTLDVTFAGYIFFTGDANYPFGFAGEFQADGGTGRFANAWGSAAMSGAFTGIPGELYFSFEGTLHSDGK